MPKLKVLHLYGNKITDEGYGFLIDSLKAISQHIVVKLQKYSSDLGHKFIKPALKEFIKYAQEKGVDTTHIVTDKESLDYIKNIKTISGNILVGYGRCSSIIIDLLYFNTDAPTLTKDILIEKYASKTAKKADFRVCLAL